MIRLLHFLLILVVNAVPVLGFFLEGWSWGTVLGIYWFENVAAFLFMAARIVLHRRWVPVRGHFRYQARKEARQLRPGPYLPNFLAPGLVFSIVHAVLLLVLLFVLTGKGAGNGPDLGSLFHGCGLVLVALTIDFFVDLPRLRDCPFAWIERRSESILGRVIAIHLVIIFGIAAAALTETSRALFAVFAGLKTLADLSSWLPRWEPEIPPPWLCRLMDKTPDVNPGRKFADFWIRDQEEEVLRRASNEKPWRD